MPHLTDFHVRQSEFSYLASLESPAFDVLGTGGQLYGAIYKGLGRFRVKLGDIKQESPTLNPADLSVACYLLDRWTVIRYRLERVEVWSTNPRALGEQALADLIEDALSVLRAASHTARVATHTLGLGVHGLLSQGTIADQLAAYVPNAPEGIPPFRPSGVSFYCQWPEGQGESSVVLEHSLVVQNGMFIRGTSVHQGNLPERKAFERAAEFFQSAIMRLGLKLDWGS